MPRIGSRRSLLSLSAYDSAAEAYFSAVSAAGGSFTVAQKKSINTFIVGLKAAGLYSKLDRLYINTGGNLASAAIDVITRVSRTAVNTPTYNSSGVKYNGSSSYFRCDIAPSQATKLTATSGCAFMFFDSLDYPLAFSGYLMGCNGSTSSWFALEMALPA